MRPGDRLSALGSNQHGLDPSEVERRQARFGPNEPARRERQHYLARFAENFTHTLALLLWFAAGLAFAAGINELGGAIVAVVAINGVFAFVQEFRAEQVVEALMHRAAIPAHVVRAGAEHTIGSAEVVPGDILRLAAGDVVPADAILLAADGLALDLSMLTGETIPVERSPEPQENGERLPVADLRSVLPAGASVVAGSGEAVVFATGPLSTLGTVAALVTSVRRGGSLLERQIAGLSHFTAIIAVVAGAATLSLASQVGSTDFLTALTFSTGVIVALVPEGLLPTMSVALAIGASRMAERGAAVRRLSAVEVIGSVTVICTDKTGTLTENSLTVAAVVEAEPGALANASLAAVLCNDARPVDGNFEGDALDAALLRWAASKGTAIGSLRAEWTRTAYVPFDAHRRYMSVTCRAGDREVEFLKGAPEEVLRALDAATPPPIERGIEEATARGERVLLLASRERGQATVHGLVRFEDPPRPEAAAAMDSCRRAGIRVAMLTGDHPATAVAIAARTGLGEGLPVISGSELDAMSDQAIAETMRGNAVFARIDPQQKLRIVGALRSAGEVVVVTGDGVNDAAALRAADVGVAMGRRGTEVAKQAADVVLADDNFATIVAGIEEGRSLRRNIQRFVSYVFTSNVAELLPFVLYIFLPVPLALKVIQALAIDVGTDLLPALALGAEPPSGREMRQPPERTDRPLLTRELGLRTFLFFGALEAAIGLAGFAAFEAWHGWRPSDSFGPYASIERAATTATFLAIVGGQVGCLVSQRDGSLWRRLGPSGNDWMVWGLGFELTLSLALVYLPGLNSVFQMEALHPGWLALVPIGATVFIAADLARRVLAHRPAVVSAAIV